MCESLVPHPQIFTWITRATATVVEFDSTRNSSKRKNSDKDQRARSDHVEQHADLLIDED